jgi:hypothetical protein
MKNSEIITGILLGIFTNIFLTNYAIEFKMESMYANFFFDEGNGFFFFLLSYSLLIDKIFFQ